MTVIEAMVASLVLVTGVLSTFAVIDGSRDLTTISERKEAAAHRAQLELERTKAIPFATLELASAPGTSADPLDPRSQVSGSPASYDWDQASASNPLEQLAVATGPNADAIAPRTAWQDGRYGGTVDTFVTRVATDLKRVTVAVRLDGDQGPRRAVIVSSLVSRQGTTAP